jgi:hypothetical protein
VAWAGEPAAQAPVNTEVPTISGGGLPGQLLSCSPGAWTGTPAPSFSYTWLRDETLIAGADEPSYTPPVSEEPATFLCEVIASNAAGEQSVRSRGLLIPGLGGKDGPVSATRPVNDSPPVISDRSSSSGTVESESGEALSCSPGVWAGSPTPSYSYQWLSNEEPIVGATSSSFTVPTPDEAVYVCEVTASNVAGQASARSQSVLPAPHWSTGVPLAEVELCGRSIDLYASTAPQEALDAGLACSGHAKIASIRRSERLTLRFAAVRQGMLTARWYQRQRASVAARKRKSRLVLVASGDMSYPGATALEVLQAKLTMAGKAILKRAKRLELIANATFTPIGQDPITANHRIVLRGS